MRSFIVVCLISAVSCLSIEKPQEGDLGEDHFIDPNKTIDKFRWNFETVNGAGTYRQGEQAYLSVKVTDNGAVDENDDWKFCTWTRVRDGAYCRFSYDCDGTFCDIGVGNFYISKSCSAGIDSRVKFFGEDPNVSNQVCGLEILSVSRDDSSEWKVQVEECRVTGCGTSDGNGYVISTSVNVVVN